MRLANADVLSRHNPCYARGQVACLAPVRADSFTRAGLRVLEEHRAPARARGSSALINELGVSRVGAAERSRDRASTSMRSRASCARSWARPNTGGRRHAVTRLEVRWSFPPYRLELRRYVGRSRASPRALLPRRTRARLQPERNDSSGSGFRHGRVDRSSVPASTSGWTTLRADLARQTTIGSISPAFGAPPASTAGSDRFRRRSRVLERLQRLMRRSRPCPRASRARDPIRSGWTFAPCSRDDPARSVGPVLTASRCPQAHADEVRRARRRARRLQRASRTISRNRALRYRRNSARCGRDWR
jgi:hypothetical protein